MSRGLRWNFWFDGGFGLQIDAKFGTLMKSLAGGGGVEIIARIHTDFATKFGVPRQSGLAPSLKARIVFEAAYRHPDFIKGLDAFSHIWLLWQFSESPDKVTATVRPPRLGGNTRMGVFATRSPFRPNRIALSSVKLESIELDTPEGPVLVVSGADLMDGTPILDIKPYLAYTDSHPDAIGGFTDTTPKRELAVDFPDMLLQKIPQEQRNGLVEVLAQDPRPAYQNDPERLYGFVFAGHEVKFTVCEDRLTVQNVE